jgi:hypothetical protein
MNVLPQRVWTIHTMHVISVLRLSTPLKQSR